MGVRVQEIDQGGRLVERPLRLLEVIPGDVSFIAPGEAWKRRKKAKVT
jgi:hypothetical protein